MLDKLKNFLQLGFANIEGLSEKLLPALLDDEETQETGDHRR